MKKRKRIRLLILLIFSMASTAAASETASPGGIDQQEIYREQYEIVGGGKLQEALPDDVQNYMGYITPTPDLDLGKAIGQVISRTQPERQGAVRSALSTLFRIAVILLFCGCASGVRLASGDTAPPAVISLAGALGITAVVFGDMKGLLSLCILTIERLSVFSKAMLPVMAASLGISGAPATAAMSSAVTMFTFDFLITFIHTVLVPAVSAYIAIITVNAAMGNDTLSRLAAFVKWLSTGTLKLFLTVFIAYITISGSVSGGVDGMAVKAARFALSGSVPVVGGIISDATETLLGGAALLKNSLGIFGMLCIVALCIVPFLQAGISYLTFRAGAAVLSPICSRELGQLVAGIADSIGMMLGMLGTCSAILFFELVFCVTVVKPV